MVAATSGDTATALAHGRDAMDTARRHFDVFALRTSVPIIASARLAMGEPERAARLLGWYQSLVERTEQQPWPTIRDLVDDTFDAARTALGPVAFARTAASGAALTLPELIAADSAA